MNIAELQQKTIEELIAICGDMGLGNDKPLPKTHDALMYEVLQGYVEKFGPDLLEGGLSLASGVLEILPDGYGFLRHNGRRPDQTDAYVSQSQIRRFNLRTGDLVLGQVRLPKDSERYRGLTRVEAVNGLDPEVSRRRKNFEHLTPVSPDVQLKLETTSGELATRMLDILSPVGRGQRGLIVAPPKAGKTTLLKQIAAGITANYSDVHVMVALIGERPEEVTDVQRSIQGEVYSATFDEPVEDHCKVAELVLERAKRLVESGKDVAILLDSITRMTRAYNLSAPTSGRTLSGGIDPVAFYPSKKFFGAARNAEDGGSLTILAACLVDTGSRMDDVIYEEFKGTGNMEIHLDRRLSERRVYPAIDIAKSGTRREELMLSPETLKQTWLLRRMISLMNSQSNHDSKTSVDVVEQIFNRLKATKTNQEFLDKLNKDASAKSAK